MSGFLSCKALQDWAIRALVTMAAIDEVRQGMPNGKHRVFDSETDLMYPPDWVRFVAFLETTIRGGIEYFKTFQSCWMSETLSGFPNESELELALKAGETEFKFLAQ